MPGPHAGDLHIALGDQPTNQEVGQPERHADVAGNRPSRDALTKGDGLHDLPIVFVFSHAGY